MPLKINYLTASDKLRSLIGKITFYNTYKKPSAIFPYFFLGTKSEIINFDNWPYLVPYLYNKKLGYFTEDNNKYQFKDTFLITGFYINNNTTITLTFSNKYSLKALNALIEDRELFRFENGSYNNWNRTVTFLSDISANNKIILNKKENYKIENLIKLTNNQINMEIKIAKNENVNLQLLNNKEIEFGLYRIEGKKQNESILYHGINNKYFCTPSEIDFFGGLRNRSQIVSHYHDHKHSMNNHTHKLVHNHDLSNHSHDITHTHNYSESVGSPRNYITGPTYIQHTYHVETYWGQSMSLFGAIGQDMIKNSLLTREITDPPSFLNTDKPDISITGSAVNSSTGDNTSINLTKTTSMDGLLTNENNFKIGNKNLYDSNIVYAYIYGGKFK